MSYVRRFTTTGKFELPQGVKREVELLYIHDIVNLIQTHKITKLMVLNLDQTPVEYVPSGKTTLAKQSTSSVPVCSFSDKRMVIATFIITLEEIFLRMQLIYSAKHKIVFRQ